MPSEEIPSGAVASEIPSPNDEAAPQQGSSTHIEISDYDPTPRPADN